MNSIDTRGRARLLGLILLFLACCLAPKAYGQEELFPEVGTAEVGSLTSREGTYEIGSHSYRTDYGTLVVPENRSDPESEVLELPLIRMHATGKNSGVPIFLLTGGPGSQNVYSGEDLTALGMEDMPYRWLLENHDFVMVGYRGFDGDSYLDTPLSDEALKVDRRPLSRTNLENMGRAMREDFMNLKAAGVDVDAYNAVEVAGDMESARIALGYKNVNLYSQSYGTRVAYIYGLLHPNSIQRTVMVSASFPGGFVWEPATVEAQLQQYGELWKEDPACQERTPDILQTMRSVLASLEGGKKWLFFDIDIDKVKIMTFRHLYHVESAAQLFDAYVAAERGDYSGMAFLSVAYDMGGPIGLGDLYSKAVSLDFEPGRDYMKEMELPGAVLGSPLGKLSWGPATFDAWPMKPVADRFRTASVSMVQTLIVNGNIDFSTPLSRAEKYLDCLPNAQLVVVSNAGHVFDVENLQPEAFQQLVRGFLATGRAESSFVVQPVDFSPATRLTYLAKQYVIKSSLMVLAPLGLVTLLSFWLLRKRRRRNEEVKSIGTK